MYLSKFEKEMTLLKTLGVRGFRAMPFKRLLGFRSLLKDEKFTRLGERVVINSFLPPFPSRAFDRLADGISMIAERKAVPVSAYVSVTDRCFYRCWHCSKSFRRGTEMSSEVIERSIGELQDLGVCIVGFTGGEPLLRPDICELVDRVDDRSVSIIFTTGDGLTRDVADRLQQNRLFGMAVSLDHYEPEIHDERRGHKGAYETAVRAIGESLSHGFYTMIQIVATREMAGGEFMGRYLDLAARLGVHEIRLLEPMPAGNLLKCAGSCTLGARERDELRRIHVKTNRSRRLPKVCAFAHIEDKSLYGCGAGFQHLYIDAHGNVCPCDFTPISFGNVKEQSVQEIWSRMNSVITKPRCTCLLMDNAKKIQEMFADRLPIDYSAAKNICEFVDGQDVPQYYRVLGWRQARS